MEKRPLCLLIVVFTPLSIRRGGGGEAVEGDKGEPVLPPFEGLGEAFH